jgi:long-chain acyl-CoA synthetase
VYAESEVLAKYLIKNDLCPKITSDNDGTNRFIALYSKNREEWTITDYASMITGIVSVPLYDTLGIDSIEYILN